MSLKTRLQEDMHSAMRAADKERTSVLRFALAAVQRREVDTRRPLDDAGVQAVLEKLVKQGEEALQQYAQGGREDLVQKQAAELALLRGYLPEPLDSAAIDTLIAEVLESTGATSPKDMGRVMQEIKQRAGGRIDVAAVSQQVRAALSAE
jgi:uncharacterized protein YqeY